MKNEKKELIKKFKVVVEDLLDNYEVYSKEEQAQIKEIFQKVADLNKVLDKYDLDSLKTNKKSSWTEYLVIYSRYFDLTNY